MDDLFAAAIGHHQASQLAAAEGFYRQILAIDSGNARALHLLGLLAHQTGRHDLAIDLIGKAISQNSHEAGFHNNLGLAYLAQTQLEQAGACFQRALALKPDLVETHCNLGNVLNAQGRPNEAIAAYQRALAVRPDYAEAHSNLGNVLQSQGRLEEAVVSYRQALRLRPDFAEAHSNLGNVLKHQGKLGEALACYKQALTLKPDLVEAHYNLGNVLQQNGQLHEAEAAFRRALAIRPSYAEANFNLGNVLRAQGRLVDAAAAYEQALAVRADYAEAHANLALVLREQGRLEEAVASYRRAVASKPDSAEMYSNLGLALKDRGQLDEAIACFERAISINPACVEAHCNLGSALGAQGRQEEAVASYRRALSVKPDYPEALSNLGTALQEQGRLEEAVASYRSALLLEPDHMTVRSNLLFTLNCAGHYSTAALEEARQYGRIAQKKVATRFSSWLCSAAPERLRVGLVSGDLWAHPVGFFLESVLDRIDPKRIELIAYPAQPKVDALTSRLRAKCAAWQPLFGSNDEAAAGLIHADAVHILIDLAGHTAKNRLPVFAWKPAPVQASWLGYFATTGLVEMDYLLADPHVVPPEQECQFTERVWRLPETYRCFTPPDVALDPGLPPCLASGTVTFGCFNNLAKITEEVVALWSRVLAAVPGSRLFLKANQLNAPAAGESVRRLFAARGIAPERLVLEGPSPRGEMLAAYRRVDILLDPFPYPGGTTTMEALWMGVPFVTRSAETMLARGGESIARNTQLADWIAASEEEYVAKAVAAANDPARLAVLRASLRPLVLASPMCDATRFAQFFEAAMWEMWRRYTGQAPLASGSSSNSGKSESTAALFADAVHHHRTGQLAAAETLYRQVLALEPNNPSALHLLGVLAHQMGRNDVAAELISKAIAQNGHDAAFHGNLGVVLQAERKLDEAVASYRRALALNPAIAELHSNLGNIFRTQGRLQEAVASYARALALRPDLAEAHNNLGTVLKDRGELEEAIKSYRRALALKPDYVEAYSNLGNALRRQGKLEEAAASFERALALRPNDADVHSNLGNALTDQRKLDLAVASYRRALSLRPDYAEAHNNLGIALREQSKLAEAAESFERALATKPDYVEAHNNLGSVLASLCRFDEAVERHRRALAIDSKQEWAASNLLYTLSYHPTLPATEIAQAFRDWGDRVGRATARLPQASVQPLEGRRLRIGYVSPDFRNHSTRFYLLPLLQHHDRSAFELYAYSNVLRPDDHTERFRLLFDHWAEIRGLTDEAAAALIRSHGLDLLIDVTNHMADHRLGIFARKPAPVQATWLGTCWTTGLAAVDYAIQDPFMAPAGSDALFVERVIRLPNTLFCYQPDNAERPISPLPAMRNGFITFGYSGRSERLNDELFAAWAAILRQVPTARLLLDYSCFGDPATAHHFLGQMTSCGVDADRVTMRSSPTGWQALADIDILLDSFPHSGGTMLFDAIWAGVPCITLAARPPVGRVGTCIMSNLGLSDWIASDIDGYVAVARAKAAQIDALARLRQTLRSIATASPLADPSAFARDMEQAFRQMIGSTGRPQSALDADR